MGWSIGFFFKDHGIIPAKLLRAKAARPGLAPWARSRVTGRPAFSLPALKATLGGLVPKVGYHGLSHLGMGQNLLIHVV